MDKIIPDIIHEQKFISRSGEINLCYNKCKNNILLMPVLYVFTVQWFYIFV